MAAPTRVQTYYAHQQASGVSSTAAFGSNVTAGNTLILCAQWFGTTATISSIVQSAGTATIGTVTILNDFAASSRSGASVWIPVTGSGSLTLTMTLSAGANQNLFGWEVAGADGTAPIDAHTGQRVAVDSDGTDDPPDGITSGAVTTTVNNCLILAFATGNSQTLVAGTGYTLQEAHNGTEGGYSEYINDQGSAGSINGLFSRTAGGTAAAGLSVNIIAVAPTSSGETPSPGSGTLSIGGQTLSMGFTINMPSEL